MVLGAAVGVTECPSGWQPARRSKMMAENRGASQNFQRMIFSYVKDEGSITKYERMSIVWQVVNSHYCLSNVEGIM